MNTIPTPPDGYEIAQPLLGADTHTWKCLIETHPAFWVDTSEAVQLGRTPLAFCRPIQKTSAPTPPEGYALYEGPYDWKYLPTGSIAWLEGRWEKPSFLLSACPNGIYATPKLRLPDVPKDPAPRLTILEEAQDLVNGDRQASYGDAYESFDRIAKMSLP